MAMTGLARLSVGALAAVALACTLLLSTRETVAGTAQDAAHPPQMAHAIFAAGCFWCVESDFDRVPGVTETTSGYTGGTRDNPTYENHTGHVEAVRVTYDPAKVTYKQLLDYYWHHVDLTDGEGQFCDRGPSYRPVIFVGNDAEAALAKASKSELERSGRFKQVAVQIEPASKFFPAEDYHQDYYTKNPLRYRYYRAGCGRDARLEQIWGTDYRH